MCSSSPQLTQVFFFRFQPDLTDQFKEYEKVCMQDRKRKRKMKQAAERCVAPWFTLLWLSLSPRLRLPTLVCPAFLYHLHLTLPPPPHPPIPLPCAAPLRSWQRRSAFSRGGAGSSCGTKPGRTRPSRRRAGRKRAAARRRRSDCHRVRTAARTSTVQSTPQNGWCDDDGILRRTKE